MLVNGDKIVAKKDVVNVIKEGEICKVVEIADNGMISFAFGNNFVHMGVMTSNEFKEYFDKYEEPKQQQTVTNEMIEKILQKSNISVQTIYDKCTIVTCHLPNGFVIVEYSACVDPRNYDIDLGVEICMNRIKDKLWELEGYKLQDKLYEEYEDCDCPCEEECCDGCEYFEEECDGCWLTDLDCDDCEHRDECWS